MCRSSGRATPRGSDSTPSMLNSETSSGKPCKARKKGARMSIPATENERSDSSSSLRAKLAKRWRQGLGRREIWALRVLSVLAILVAWELYGRSSNPLLFTYPTAVARAAVDMVADGSLIRALGQSLSVLASGFVIGTVIGIALGLLAGRSTVAAALLELPVNALYATPMVALILPSALPFIVTGIRLAIGRALIGVIVAEFYTAFAGLGYLIVDNANTFKTARVFVPIVVLMALGVALTALLEWAEGRVAPWQKATR